MIAVIQRVRGARVEVAGRVTGAIEQGLLVLVCAEPEDTTAQADKLLDKLLKRHRNELAVQVKLQRAYYFRKQVLAIFDELVTRGRVIRGWLGIEAQALSRELAASFGLRTPQGVIVAGVVSGGPAAEAGPAPSVGG